ncbi:MAG: segregation/condensation protein A [Phycisphaerae bacterium]|nr:segregation/condensation protein A [Phycisphaerae bacterium]
MAEYRVNLEMYNGPLDLLLYLIRRDEVDIHDIPIVSITEQYLSYVDMLQALDPNLAGEFLVMAATLIEIKSRMLLPVSEAAGEDGEDEFGIDPRADLVRQLLQYKAFKDAAGDLQLAAELHALKHARRPGRVHLGDEKDVDLEEVRIWDLFDAFRGVMDAIGRRPQNHEVIYDDTPVELHAEDILDRLQRDGAMSFEKIFEGRDQRSEIIGLFLALLELIRLQKIFVVQGENFGRIDVHVNPNPPEERDVEHLFARATLGDEDREGFPEAVDEKDFAEASPSDYISEDDELDDEDADPDGALGRYVSDVQEDIDDAENWNPRRDRDDEA